MIATILSYLAEFVIVVISTLGYPGIVLLMAIESACTPLPSEVILPFSGFLVVEGQFTLFGVATAGAIGCNIGSMGGYYMGMYGGRPLLLRYGRYVLISRREIDLADRWFARYGEVTIFFSRLLPIIRTYISFPAGVARMGLWKFNLYTFLGSWPWCYGLAYAGYRLGARWPELEVYFHEFDFVIGIFILAGLAAFIWLHKKQRHAERNSLAGDPSTPDPAHADD